MNIIIDELRQELQENSNEIIRQSALRFFKEPIDCYGIKSADVKNTGKRYFQLIKNQSKKEIFDLCSQLFESGKIEESFIACNWSHSVNKKYEESDFLIFQTWVNNYVSNWATCDTFCNHTVGSFIENFPEYLPELKKWTESGNRWVKRASAVSLIVPAKKGKFLADVFEIADKLLLDKDDMVQKGYGWLLKVAAAKHENEVFEYVMKHKAVMPRTALRYAIEKMPQQLRAEAMSK